MNMTPQTACLPPQGWLALRKASYHQNPEKGTDMAKMNYQKQNKFKNGSLDLRDELKSMGERWLEKHDPTIIKHTRLTKEQKAEQKKKRRQQKRAKKYAKQLRKKQRANQ